MQARQHSPESQRETGPRTGAQQGDSPHPPPGAPLRESGLGEGLSPFAAWPLKGTGWAAPRDPEEAALRAGTCLLGESGHGGWHSPVCGRLPPLRLRLLFCPTGSLGWARCSWRGREAQAGGGAGVLLTAGPSTLSLGSPSGPHLDPARGLPPGRRLNLSEPRGGGMTGSSLVRGD